MCNRHAYHHRKKAYSKFGHWMSGNPGRWGKHQRYRGWGMYPPVNVQELDGSYELFVFAPGLTKEDFKISLVDNLLGISVEQKDRDENTKWRRQEFSPGGFKRQFELNEKIDKEAISAEYSDGVLHVSLPKLEGFETARQDIVVA